MRSYRIIKRLLFLGGFFLSAFTASYLTSLPSNAMKLPPPARNSPLVIPADHLNFGTTYAQTSFPLDLPITNVSGEDVTIDDIKTSCTCTTLYPRTMTIRPGVTKEIHVVLDLTPNSPTEAQKTIRRFSATLLPIVMGYEYGEIGWEVQGAISNALSIEPSSVFYGESVLVKDSPIPTKSVRLTTKKPLSSVELYCDDSFGTASVIHANDEKREWEIQVTPSATLPLGDFSYGVLVRAFDNANEPLPEVHLVVRGKILPDVQAFPATLSLGQQFLGKQVKSELTISSTCGELFRVSQAGHGDDVTSVTSSQNNPPQGSSHRFTVILMPASTGSQETQLRFVVEKPGEAREEVLVPITYYVFDESNAVHLPVPMKPNSEL